MTGKGKWGCEICKITFDGCMYLHITNINRKILVFLRGRINVMIRVYA